MTIPASFTLFGVTLHWYGLLIGLGIGLGWLVVTRRADTIKRGRALLENSLLWLIVGGVVGARAWHVVTDWSIYQYNFLSVFQVWNGGLSIFGAIAGVFIAWFAFVKVAHVSKKDYWLVPDLLAYGAPITQVFGRVGNWINQELVGLPTGLPWGMSVDKESRPAGFENEEFYHPLFAYEIVILLFIWRWLWMKFHARAESFGTGHVVLQYLSWYCGFRFFLDFLRLERGTLYYVGGVALGINQLVLLLVLAGLGIYWWSRHMDIKNKVKGYATTTVLGLTFLVLTFMATAWFFWERLPLQQLHLVGRMELGIQPGEKLDNNGLHTVPDRSKVKMHTSAGEFVVEVVTTSPSISQGLSGREEIGADAMLFAFPNKSVRTFWMPNMKFDLDMVWLDDGTVVGVTSNVAAPDPSVPLSELQRYSSGAEINQVLEVPSGRAESMGLGLQETVSFSGL